MRGMAIRVATVTLLGVGAIFLSAAFLSFTTKKPLFGMRVPPKGLEISPQADVVTAMCRISEKKDVYFAGCGGL